MDGWFCGFRPIILEANAIFLSEQFSISFTAAERAREREGLTVSLLKELKERCPAVFNWTLMYFHMTPSKKRKIKFFCLLYQVLFNVGACKHQLDSISPGPVIDCSINKQRNKEISEKMGSTIRQQL